MAPSILEIASRFELRGRPVSAAPHGAGHINDTYAVACEDGAGGYRRYVVQRIERRIFGDPARLMSNVEAVTRHLRGKILEAGGDPERETLTIVPTTEGSGFLKADDGEYWRAYHFIEHAHSLEAAESPAQFRQAGGLLGRFHGMLSDFPMDSLYETIPSFHDTKMRYERFAMAVEADAAERARGVHSEIEFLQARRDEASTLVDLIGEGELPLRVTHNDTKFNNIMIDDDSGACLCLVDLDTVMPGLYLYDFGDAIRTGANAGSEDERDLSKASMDLSMFEAFAGGYLEAAGPSVAPLERELLPFSARLLTLEAALRFLTDYLEGDTYYKVHRPGHNLDRARTQIALVADMERKADAMRKAAERHG